MQRTEYLRLLDPQPIYLTREYVKRSPYCAVVCDGRQFDSRRAQYLFHNNSNRAGARGPLTFRQVLNMAAMNSNQLTQALTNVPAAEHVLKHGRHEF